MDAVTVRRAGLVVHLFAPTDGPRRLEALNQLRHLWSALRRNVGMSAAIPAAGIAEDFPGDGFLDRPAPGSEELLAAQQQPVPAPANGDGPVFQALLRRHDDVLVLSVAMYSGPTAIEEAADGPWPQLQQLWHDLAAPTDALLGLVRIYLGTVPRSSVVDVETASRLSNQLPVHAKHPLRWRQRFSTAGGFGLWELTDGADDATERDLLALAASGLAEELSAWAWSRGDTAIAPLPRYLLHAAKVRYERRVRAAAGELVDRSAIGRGEPLPIEPAVLGQLRAMRRAVEAAMHNMSISLGAFATGIGEGPGPLADDLAVARALLDSIDDDLSAVEGQAPESAGQARILPSTRSSGRDILVVHGRDHECLDAFWGFLQDLDLRPLDWEDLVADTGSTTPFLGDVVDRALRYRCQAALVLMTPDDVVHLHPELHGYAEPEFETKPAGQPRPNVLFEAGIAFGLFPTRTVLVEVGELRPISDLGGRNVIKFDASVESLKKIADRLRVADCPLNTTGTRWLNTQRFARLAALTRRPAPAAASSMERE